VAGGQHKLADIQKTNRPLYRAYLLKEQLRQIYRLAPAAAIAVLDEWIAWARRCRLQPFVKIAKTITKQRAGIVAAIEHGLSNAASKRSTRRSG
jgi:transposase